VGLRPAAAGRDNFSKSGVVMRDTGIYTISNEEYHADKDSVSKTGLWKIWNSTPHHFRFGEYEDTEGQKFGRAAHVAVLEPNLFDKQFFRGPDDRRGAKWGAAVEIAASMNKDCLVSHEYDDALRLRDALASAASVQSLLKGHPAIEQSAFWMDERHVQCRVRPDLYNHDSRVMVDLKATVSASPVEWCKRIGDYGYHLQEYMYRVGWEAASRGQHKVDQFVFLCVEKTPPFAFAMYELKPRLRAEGEAIFHRVMDIYASCKVSNVWPSYASGVQEIDMPNYFYQLTKEESENE